MASVGPLKEASATAVSSGRYTELVFDLCDVSFIDSSGLHVLVEAHRQMTAKGGTVQIVCPPGQVRKIFELTAIDTFVPILSEPIPAAVAVAA